MRDDNANTAAMIGILYLVGVTAGIEILAPAICCTCVFIMYNFYKTRSPGSSFPCNAPEHDLQITYDMLAAINAGLVTLKFRWSTK